MLFLKVSLQIFHLHLLGKLDVTVLGKVRWQCWHNQCFQKNHAKKTLNFNSS